MLMSATFEDPRHGHRGARAGRDGTHRGRDQPGTRRKKLAAHRYVGKNVAVGGK